MNAAGAFTDTHGHRRRHRAGDALADPRRPGDVRRRSPPGVAKEYEAGTTANVISTAADATLTVSDPATTNNMRLVNGAFSLAEPLRVEFSKAAWTGPVSNDTVNIAFKQLIKANDPLRTGTYSKTLTFTLSTTTP